MCILLLNNLREGGHPTSTNEKEYQIVDTISTQYHGRVSLDSGNRKGTSTELKDKIFHMDGLSVRWKENIIWETSILRNKRTRAKNGNRTKTSQIKIMHWNAGAKLWINKINELESLLMEKEPEFCFISEANIWDHVPEEDRKIQGYHLVYPNTMKESKHARIVLAVRDGMKYHILREHMDPENAVIWIQVGESKKNSILLGGVYREFTQLGADNSNTTWMERQLSQERRWSKIVNKWNEIGRNRKSFIIGDINLDFNKWEQPESHQENMIELMKEKIENEGFQQLIAGNTRAMSNQDESLIDHLWTNSRQRIVKHYNETRGASDHNVIGAIISMKDIKCGGQNVVKRRWTKFDSERCQEKFKNEDWSVITNEMNIDIANSLLEDKFNSIMRTEAPFVTVQIRTKFMKWISESTKDEMRERDEAKENARVTNNPQDWEDYRRRRNECTKRQRKDKSKFLRETFDKIESEKDTGKLHKTTTQLLGSNTAGPPNCLMKDGRTTMKQEEIAEIQSEYYHEKIRKIRNHLPKVNYDPLWLLKKIFHRWNPTNGKPQFKLKQMEVKDIWKMIMKIEEQPCLWHRWS